VSVDGHDESFLTSEARKDRSWRLASQGFDLVIPGRLEEPNPESRDSGFALRAPRNDRGSSAWSAEANWGAKTGRGAELRTSPGGRLACWLVQETDFLRQPALIQKFTNHRNRCHPNRRGPCPNRRSNSTAAGAAEEPTFDGSSRRYRNHNHNHNHNRH
jgi:hypothetical protein